MSDSTHVADCRGPRGQNACDCGAEQLRVALPADPVAADTGQLAEVLHAAVDGDFLLNCKGGETVALQHAGISDVVWWAAHATASALAAARAEGVREGLRRKHCGCAWCCATTPPEQRGEMHQLTCQPTTEEPA